MSTRRKGMESRALHGCGEWIDAATQKVLIAKYRRRDRRNMFCNRWGARHESSRAFRRDMHKRLVAAHSSPLLSKSRDEYFSMSTPLPIQSLRADDHDS